MNSVMIESKPLNADQAKSILDILSRVSVPAIQVGQFMALTLSIERIALGNDVVTEHTGE